MRTTGFIPTQKAGRGGLSCGMITYGFASFLEEEGLLSPTEASMIKNDAITMASDGSETYGKILKAVGLLAEINERQ